MDDLDVTKVVYYKVGHVILHFSVPFSNLGENETEKKKEKEKREIQNKEKK